MLTSTAQLGFPRRVVALYLLFCLAALVLLASGVAFAVQSLLRSQTTGSALSRVGRLAAAIELDHVDGDAQRTQSLLVRERSESRLISCAVVGEDGRFLAHSDDSLIGALAIDPSGAQLRWGSIDGVRYRDEQGRLASEYSTQLDLGGDQEASLRLTIVEPGLAGTMLELAGYTPLVVVAPLGLIVAGGLWLRKLTSPVADIENRLLAVAAQPHGEPPKVSATAATGRAAIGWNRLVEQLRTDEEGGKSEGLEDKLKQLAAVAGGGRSTEALQSLTDGIAVTDAEGRIDFANRAIEALLGAEEPLEGRTLEEQLLASAPDLAASFNPATRDTQVIAEMPLETAGGERTLRVARAPLQSDPSRGHVWSVRDVTQQKLAEASRDQFIDTATHELRTPLANIKAYAETLAMCDMADVEEQKEFCNTINSEATRLARFVDDLLSISSIEVGSLSIDRQNVEVGRLLEEAADKVRPLIKQRSQNFETKFAAKLGEAALDKDKVSGLVVNLLGNAAKYTPEGGTITITAVRQEDAIKIEVRDTGVGISEEEQAKVFDKFFRSDNPDVQDKVGTGLGLSLAREIARLHRGDLYLESQLGEGSTFTAVLPLS